MTPHIEAKKGQFESTVLMPGDPLRAKFIAENYLADQKQINSVRGMFGYTGKYKGSGISVMASGMGMPSMGIYSYELFKFYGVENIIRLGTAGAIREDVAVGDIIAALSASTNSNYINEFNLNGHFAPSASFKLLQVFAKTAEKNNKEISVGGIVTSDVFYHKDDGQFAKAWGDMGTLAVEMETAALYINAAALGKKALSVLTVSDHLLTGESMEASARERSLTDMIELALETAV